MKISVIGVQMDFGASKRGMNIGPLAIRYAGLCEKLEAMGFEVRDEGDIVPIALPEIDGRMKNFASIKEANERLHMKVKESLAAGSFPVVLGGDHSLSAGSVSAVREHFGDIGVVWIDAHGDFNNDVSSGSGNMHGMPLSALCGFGPDNMVTFGKAPLYVDPAKVVLVGGRDFDPEERARLKASGVTVFCISNIDRMGMGAVMERAIDIAGRGTKGIHLSFDIDAVCPEGAPGVGTPVHSGLTLRESFLAAELLCESQKLLSIDMVEINAIIDDNNKTALLATELILSALGKTVY